VDNLFIENAPGVDLKRSKNEFCSSWANVSHNIEGPGKNLTERKLFSFPEIVKNFKIYAVQNQKEPCPISFRKKL
jgi:hypothetical protein